MKALKFHTKRGGQFNNAGFVKFIEFEKLEEGNTFEDFFFNEETNKWFTPSGNELDYSISEDGTGYVNFDNDYDRTDVVFENKLNQKQINALIRAKGNHWNTSEIERILAEYEYEG